MLTCKGFSAVCQMLDIGCGLRIFPYHWEPQKKLLKRGSKKDLAAFQFHKNISIFFFFFSLARFIQAMNKGNFPLLLKILNCVWCAAYALQSICMIQFERKQTEILQFVNYLLNYLKRGGIRENEDSQSKDETVQPKNKPDKGSKVLTYYVFLGMAMLASNPSVHIMLVDESPCAPHFVSSTFFEECEKLEERPNIPFLHKVPFMAIEYYLTSIMFFSWSFNWVSIFLGMSLIVRELKALGNRIPISNVSISVNSYRSLQCVSNLMNYAFYSYLGTFPTLLFAIVAILFFGIIRIWHYDPGSNLMFPLCGVRCLYEAVTPLAVAGDVNDHHKEVKRKWKNAEVKVNEDQGLLKALRRSFRLQCNAGNFYAFENSIVLCCLNNCMQLTLNMFLTFK